LKEEINLIKIFEIIMKLWWIVLIFAVIGALVAFSISTFLMTPQYTSNAKLYVDGTQRVVGTGMDTQTINASRSLVATYIEILCGNTFRKTIAKKASVDYPDITATHIKGNISMDAANEICCAAAMPLSQVIINSIPSSFASSIRWSFNP